MPHHNLLFYYGFPSFSLFITSSLKLKKSLKSFEYVGYVINERGILKKKDRKKGSLKMTFTLGLNLKQQ
jgi:hypothetical protein